MKWDVCIVNSNFIGLDIKIELLQFMMVYLMKIQHMHWLMYGAKRVVLLSNDDLERADCILWNRKRFYFMCIDFTYSNAKLPFFVNKILFWSLLSCDHSLVPCPCNANHTVSPSVCCIPWLKGTVTHSTWLFSVISLHSHDMVAYLLLSSCLCYQVKMKIKHVKYFNKVLQWSISNINIT